MQIDRDLQKRWLIVLREIYPERVDPEYVDDLYPQDSQARENQEAQLWYLHEQGLIEISHSSEIGFGTPLIREVKITHRGIDFLEDDGGLSAILGTVTVRLHADTIRDLVETKILSSDASEPEKQRLIDSLRKLPEEGLKTLTSRLINEGLSNAPGAWQALTQMLS